MKDWQGLGKVVLQSYINSVFSEQVEWHRALHPNTADGCLEAWKAFHKLNKRNEL